MTLRVHILGCGSSGGVPRVGGDWGACDPNNPRNERRRCSILVERIGPDGRTTVLVDASPDLRAQLLDAGVANLDAVLFTHDHADHTHGIDDLRVLAYTRRSRIDVYFNKDTRDRLHRRFGYCFRTPPGGVYPPILTAHEIFPLQSFDIDGPGGVISFLPFEQIHGDDVSLGFRFADIAYSSDISDVPEASMSALEGLDVWIVDALRYVLHPSHFSVKEALEWIDRVKPRRAILTHLHVDLDYGALCEELPSGVEPAYDRLMVEAATGLGL